MTMATAQRTQLLKRDLKLRGWTDTLISRLLGEPDERRHRWGGGEYCLYDTARVKKAEKRVAFRRRLERLAKPTVARRRKPLPERYPNWVDAIAPATEAMFSLNRYAKYGSCRREHRQEIYDLKNGLVETLYKLGYSTSIVPHTVPRPARVCFRCDGTGEWDNWTTGDIETCTKCGGSGEFASAHEQLFAIFRFTIAGKSYCWHQPVEYIDYDYDFTGDECQGDLPIEEKPLKMNRRNFADGKRLVRFVIDNFREMKQ